MTDKQVVMKLEDTPYTLNLPPREYSVRKPDAYVRMRGTYLDLMMQVKMWHIENEPQLLRWYVLADVGDNPTKSELKALTVKALYWRKKMHNLDDRYVLAKRGSRLYGTYDYDDRCINKGTVHVKAGPKRRK